MVRHVEQCSPYTFWELRRFSVFWLHHKNVQKPVGFHTCDLRIQEVEAGESRIQSHPWIHSEFKASLG